MNLIDLASAFKAARLQARLTQREVAQATGVSLPTISKLERGALTEIGAVKLLALLRKVGVELAPRPSRQQRTLDDIAKELDAGTVQELQPRSAQRVRHSQKEGLVSQLERRVSHRAH
jgi:HTH-type transcriptional regulator / antitoxin HipB